MAKPPTRFTSARSEGPAVWTARATASGSKRSAWTSSRRSCSSTRSSSRSATQGTTTRQPSSRKARVTAAPRPPVPPVTRTVRSLTPCTLVTSARGPTVAGVLVRDLTDGQDLDQVLLVRACEPRTRRDGTPLLKLSLGDRSGRVAAIVRDPGSELRELCQVGRAVHVRGRFELHPRFGAQIELGALSEAAPGSFALGDLVDGPPHSAETMELEVRDLVATVQDPHLHALLDRLLGPHSPTWELYRRAPAAKLYHQAYVHGLLEHCLTVAQGVSAMASTFPARARGQPLPPSLRARAARPPPPGRPGGQRDGLALPPHRPRRRGPRRPAARHRQARRVHRRSRGHRPHRCRAAAGRDPTGLLPHPPRHGGPARVPGADGTGIAAHRPQPPRLARARQPCGPVHARGVARAHDRQPGRQAGLVRSPREGPGAGRGVDRVRSRRGRQRLLRAARR